VVVASVVMFNILELIMEIVPNSPTCQVHFIKTSKNNSSKKQFEKGKTTISCECKIQSAQREKVAYAHTVAA
jgi:hypothetical protein